MAGGIQPLQNRRIEARRSATGAIPMAKGQQRSNKEAKKPKKDPTAVPKPIKAGAPPITTVIVERGKKKT
jgi:hypothetical protein